MSLSEASGAGRMSQPLPSSDTATEKSSSCLLKPLLKGDHPPLETGVVFDSVSNNPTTSKCAHRFRLEHLIRYLDGTMAMTTMTTETGGRRPQQQQQRHDVCPVCRARIVLVCDEHVVALPPDDAKDVVTFRYGKQTYRLALKDGNPNKDRWWWQQQTGSACTAQERMAKVLGMNVNDGHMKILHKGKVLYPNDSRSDAEMSQQLLEISQQDWKVATKKASLVVIGTRTGQEVRRRYGPLHYAWYGALEWGLTVVLQLTQMSLGLLLWPIKFVMRSLPPSTSGDEDRHED